MTSKSEDAKEKKLFETEKKRAELKERVERLLKEIQDTRSEVYENKTMIRLLVGDTRQRDVARGIARIDQDTMQKLGISAGDVVEISGKRTTTAIAWPAYSEDQDRSLIRIDGLTRKNAGVALNEYITVRPADVKNASSIVLAPVDMRLNVDQDFTKFVKNRLVERAFVEGDTTLVMMLGQAIPFTVTKTRPHGVVRMTYETNLQILSEPIPIPEVSLPRYTDMGGLKEQITEIRKIIEIPLRHPEVLQKFGMPMFTTKGILLYGPSGCGKTLLAEAVGNESEANFFDVDALELLSKGESVAIFRLREIFRQAQHSQPSIVFIDHIEILAPKEPQKECAKHLVALMDKLKNVVVIGTTNRLEDLDVSLLRAGRFDKKIEIGLPDEKGRYEILLIHVRGLPLSEDVDFKKIAEITSGYTGADLKHLCNEASQKALNRLLPEIDVDKPDEEIVKDLEKIKIVMEDFTKIIRNR